jgi:two-component system chemotaxis response regulator CheY
MTQFENATVLVVEDNALVRRLLTAVLRAIGVGRVVGAANGQEAIRVLRAVTARTAGGDAAGADDDPPERIDAVLSDWVMHPGDGTALLRWIRRHDDSPNRFVPFLMLSAYSDPTQVRKARDLGVTAFIAKPFTADTVARYLSIALADARRFVEVGEYFGPDRRKHVAELSEQERRDLEHSDRDKGVRFFVPPQLHEGRVIEGGGVDAKRLMAIQKVAKRVGTEIPHLCHKRRAGLPPDGNCRACMVEVEGERTLAASCIRKPTDGMVVTTDTERAEKARARWWSSCCWPISPEREDGA